MIKLFLCDTCALDKSCAERKISNTPALAGVLSVRESVRRTESAAAYILLYEAWRYIGLGELPQLLRAEGGKPYISGEAGEKRKGDILPERSFPGFNLSHRPGVALLALSDEGECGADIEADLDGDRIDRVAKRYLAGCDFYASEELDVQIVFCIMDNDGSVVFIENHDDFDKYDLHIEEKESIDSPNLGWSALEAVLKLSGGGFGDYRSREELISGAAIGAFWAKIRDKEYSICVAVEKKGAEALY